MEHQNIEDMKGLEDEEHIMEESLRLIKLALEYVTSCETVQEPTLTGFKEKIALQYMGRVQEASHGSIPQERLDELIEQVSDEMVSYLLTNALQIIQINTPFIDIYEYNEIAEYSLRLDEKEPIELDVPISEDISIYLGSNDEVNVVFKNKKFYSETHQTKEDVLNCPDLLKMYLADYYFYKKDQVNFKRELKDINGSLGYLFLYMKYTDNMKGED